MLGAALIEVIVPAVTFSVSGGTPGSGGPELLINPAGCAFAIWGVIYSLAIAQAIGVLVSGTRSVSRRLQIDLTVLYLGGTVWILLSETGSSVATAVALLVMLVAAVDAVLQVARGTIAPRWLSLLTRASVGLYAGWVSAAFFLNLGTALVDTTSLAADVVGWQLVLLAVAVVTLLVLTVRVRGNVAFAAAGAWALFGIAAASRSNGTGEVTAMAIVSIVLLAAATVALRVVEHRRPAAT